MFRILLSLILGALTTWAIAIFCSAHFPPKMISGGSATSSPAWVFRQWRNAGHVSSNYSPAFDDRMVMAYEGPKPQLIPAWSIMRHPPVVTDFDKEGLGTIWMNETGLGWPLCTFIHNTSYDGRLLKSPNFIVSQSGAFEWSFQGNAVLVPYHPRKLGFVISTLLFSLPWLLTLVVPRLVKKHFRRKRGQCTRCGYDLQGVRGLCPECGTPTPSTLPIEPRTQ